MNIKIPPRQVVPPQTAKGDLITQITGGGGLTSRLIAQSMDTIEFSHDIMGPLNAACPFTKAHSLGMIVISYTRAKNWHAGRILFMAEIMIPDVFDYLIRDIARVELGVSVTDYVREWGSSAFDIANEEIILYTRVLDDGNREALNQPDLDEFVGLQF